MSCLIYAGRSCRAAPGKVLAFQNGLHRGRLADRFRSAAIRDHDGKAFLKPRRDIGVVMIDTELLLKMEM